mmetsp:Transcript_85498/g.125137  ORF Transcript_85498/g.125137 Transcript_85498/m.125137 type:complete len:89 (+) Transcript_85498:62-328(+)
MHPLTLKNLLQNKELNIHTTMSIRKYLDQQQICEQRTHRLLKQATQDDMELRLSLSLFSFCCSDLNWSVLVSLERMIRMRSSCLQTSA